MGADLGVRKPETDWLRLDTQAGHTIPPCLRDPITASDSRGYSYLQKTLYGYGAEPACKVANLIHACPGVVLGRAIDSQTRWKPRSPGFERIQFMQRQKYWSPFAGLLCRLEDLSDR